MNRSARALLTSAGLACMVLAFVGAFVPLLPSTPFVLLAAWCFARSSPMLHRRLRQHRLFGPALRDWQAGRGVSRGAKVAAVVSITLTFTLSFVFVVEQTSLRIALSVFAIGLITFLLTRPTSR